jgi:hypothetical protein
MGLLQVEKPKKSATFVAPENSVTCGGFVGADPDRVQLLRDRPNYHQGAD